MEKERKSKKIENRLWQRRKMMGYLQNHVAFLLGHKNVSQYSRWERGITRPDLENTLKVCYILKALPEVLFPGLCRKLREKISLKEEQLKEKVSEGKLPPIEKYEIQEKEI